MLRSSLPYLLVITACTASGAGTTDDASTGSTSATTDLSESTGPATTEPTSSTIDTSSTTAESTGDPAPVIALDAPCTVDTLDPTRLALITNNFIDPASLHLLDLTTRALTPDLAPAPGDPALAWGDGKLVLIGRFGINTLDVLDGKSLANLNTLDIKLDGLADANPQALAFGPDGRAYLTLFASATLPVYDLDLPSASAQVDSLDLTTFADSDGSPEPGLAFTCGDVMFVAIQRLVDFAPIDLSWLVAIDLTTGALLDLDPTTDGPDALPLLGPWPRQARLDPSDPDGHTVLLLTSGVERVDLAHATSTWAAHPDVLAMADLGGYDPQAFTVTADGTAVHLLATDGDFPAAAVYRIHLDHDAAPTPLVTGLSSREKTLERTANTLWVGDALARQLRSFNLDDDSELPPIATPGEPYLLLAIP